MSLEDLPRNEEEYLPVAEQTSFRYAEKLKKETKNGDTELFLPEKFDSEDKMDKTIESTDEVIKELDKIKNAVKVGKKVTYEQELEEFMNYEEADEACLFYMGELEEELSDGISVSEELKNETSKEDRENAKKGIVSAEKTAEKLNKATELYDALVPLKTFSDFNEYAEREYESGNISKVYEEMLKYAAEEFIENKETKTSDLTEKILEEEGPLNVSESTVRGNVSVTLKYMKDDKNWIEEGEGGGEYRIRNEKGVYEEICSEFPGLCMPEEYEESDDSGPEDIVSSNDGNKINKRNFEDRKNIEKTMQ